MERSGFGVDYNYLHRHIDALRFTCTDREGSEWFGGADEYNIEMETFDVGIAFIKSQQVTVSYTFIGMMYVTGYDLTLANGVIEKP